MVLLIMKKTILAIVAMMALSVAGAKAQDKVEGTIGADIVSRYYWRGQALGDSVPFSLLWELHGKAFR